MRKARYEARKFVSADKEYFSAGADSTSELCAAVRDSAGFYTVYDLQPPDPGVTESVAGTIESDGRGTAEYKPRPGR